jgi:transcriptional regulator with XRE-family HTH domain
LQKEKTNYTKINKISSESFKKNMKKYNKKTDLEIEIYLCQLILRARLHAGLSQKELAEKIGTKQSNIARVESGRSIPTDVFLNKVAVAIQSEFVLPEFGFMKEVFTQKIEIKQKDRGGIVLPSQTFKDSQLISQ